MDNKLTIVGVCGLGFVLGVLGQSMVVRHRLKKLAPMMSSAIITAVKTAYDQELPYSDIMDNLKVDMKFIEQVLS